MVAALKKPGTAVEDRVFAHCRNLKLIELAMLFLCITF
jgi:hypothetical protein